MLSGMGNKIADDSHHYIGHSGYSINRTVGMTYPYQTSKYLLIDDRCQLLVDSHGMVVENWGIVTMVKDGLQETSRLMGNPRKFQTSPCGQTSLF